MMVFPMKAKHMAMVMGAISIVTILDSGGNWRGSTWPIWGFITGAFYFGFESATAKERDPSKILKEPWTRPKISGR